jgi:hypothetical protein
MRAYIIFLLTAFLLAGCHSKDRFLGAPPATPYSYHGDVLGTSAVILWRTDSPASSVVEYGPDERFGLTAGSPAERVQFHRVALTGLAASSLFHCRVRSLDIPGNTVYSYDRTFRTYPAGIMPATIPLRFSDDFNGTLQWTPQTYTNSQGVTSVNISLAPVTAWNNSLQVHCNLVAGDSHLSKGEVFLDAAGADDKAADGVSVDFQNMQGKQIQADIYAYTGSGECIDTSILANYGSNGIQLFVKDVYSRSQYGGWFNISEGGTGFTVSMTVDTSCSAPGCFTDSGFDPTAVAMVGVKIGLADPAPLNACSSSGNWLNNYFWVHDVRVTPWP